MDKANKIIEHWLSLNDPNEYLYLDNLESKELYNIPESCLQLNCRKNKLKSLPLRKYEGLRCSNNALEYLPDLESCKDLKCEYNNLSYLPDLPKCEILLCLMNNLISLPELPECIELYCGNNYLTFLPELPKCITLHCSNNNLLYLPKMPHIRNIYCMNNKYLYISKKQAKKYHLKETPNYNRAVLKIQKFCKKYMRSKYSKILNNYVINDLAKLICMYV